MTNQANIVASKLKSFTSKCECPKCGQRIWGALRPLVIAASAEKNPRKYLRSALWSAIKQETEGLGQIAWLTGEIPAITTPIIKALKWLQPSTCNQARHEVLEQAQSFLFNEETGALEALILTGKTDERSREKASKIIVEMKELQGWTCHGQREKDEAVDRLNAAFDSQPEAEEAVGGGMAKMKKSGKTRTAHFASQSRAMAFAHERKGTLSRSKEAPRGNTWRVLYPEMIPAWTEAPSELDEQTVRWSALDTIGFNADIARIHEGWEVLHSGIQEALLEAVTAG